MLLRDVAGRQGRTLAEEELLEMGANQLLAFLLPRHDPVLVEDHLLAILPELPGLRRHVLENSLAELARPGRHLETRHLLLELHAKHRTTAHVRDASTPIMINARPPVEPEDRHRLCWYGRRTDQIPQDPGLHTIVDGQLLYCAHPLFFPVMGTSSTSGTASSATSIVRSGRRPWTVLNPTASTTVLYGFHTARADGLSRAGWLVSC